ncbi:MAG: protein kinase, partial [Myxococcota bacterium]
MKIPGMWIFERILRGGPGLVCGALTATTAAARPSAPTIGATTIQESVQAFAAAAGAAYHAWRASGAVARSIDAFLTSEAGTLAMTGLALVLLLVLVQIGRARRRATGDLTLHLRFPDGVDGDFEVRLVKPGRRRDERKAIRRTGVRRETQFDGVPPGEWRLEIEGRLFAAKSRAELATIEERRDVVVTLGACTDLEHTLPPVEAPLEFRIHWDRQPAHGVGLGLADRPETVRYATQVGIVRSTLPLGAHVIVVGAGDRIVERPCRVASYEPSLVSIDLADADGLVFKGCPPAVGAFLQGDLAQAANALDRDGQADVAALLLARLHQAQGRTEAAAEQLENAGRAVEAAQLRKAISDFDRAAALFENAGELRSAAEMYDAAGAWDQAARAYAALEDWAAAARCYEAAGDTEGFVGALEGQGEILRAAALATETGDRARAIRLLQQVGPGDEAFGRAGELLALAYEQEGHLDLAAHQLERCLEALGPGESAPALEVHLAELLEDSGEMARALGVLETLRDRDPTYPRVANKIETLRKKLTNAARRESGAAFTPPAGATAFVAEERYEIVEEVGRGGMGLVYRARDRRLGRTVALKRMPENLRDHPTAVQLFLTEAQAAARMNHPNIVTLYDADQENGSFFITMELLEGLPLNAILKQRGRFGPRDTARLGLQVCAGLQYAHAAGIVHRDIKTSNLFITRDRVLKIMDFGLAKILEAVRDGNTT